MKFLAPVCQVQPAARRKLTQLHDWKEVTAVIYGARNTKRIFIIFASLSASLLHYTLCNNVVELWLAPIFFWEPRPPFARIPTPRLRSPYIRCVQNYKYCHAPFDTRRLGGSLLGGYLWAYFVLSGANSVYLWILIRREVEIAILKNYEIRENFPPWIEKLFQAPLAESTLHVFANNPVRGRPVLDLWFIYRHFSSLRYRRGRKSRRINRSMAACAITIEIKSKRGKDSLSFLDNSHLASLLSSLFTINFLSVSLSLRFSDAETRGGGERKPSLCRTGAA